jgi:uncharacterized protein Veg
MNQITKAKKAPPLSKDIHKMEFPEPKEKITIIESSGRKHREIKGTVDKVYDTFISVKLDGKKIKESFLKVDFLTGDLKMV